MASIRSLISITLAVVGAGFGCWGNREYCDQYEEFNPFDFDEEPFDAEAFDAAAMAKANDGEWTPWSAIGYQCRAACVYMLGGYSYSYGGYGSRYGLTIDECVFTPSATGARKGTVSCSGYTLSIIHCGRRPLIEPPPLEPGADYQAHLDGCARMEHDSVLAFIELAEQLEYLGAPLDLIARCRSASGDEREHAEAFVRLGAVMPTRELRSSGPRPLLEIALHNAVEGCVHETWGALLAAFQSDAAIDPALRVALSSIAQDEAIHADLAWDIHRWACDSLEPELAALTEQALDQGLRELPERVERQADCVGEPLRLRLGLPDREQAVALSMDFTRRLRAASRTLDSASS